MVLTSSGIAHVEGVFLLAAVPETWTPWTPWTELGIKKMPQKESQNSHHINLALQFNDGQIITVSLKESQK